MSFTVVVGYDYSADSEGAVDHALRLCALRPDAVVHVVHAAVAHGDLVELEVGGAVKHVPEAEATANLATLVDAKVAALRQEGLRLQPSQVWHHVASGPPAPVLVDFAAAHAADLVIVGTHGRRGVKRFLLGSVAESVVRAAGCAVLVVRPKSYGEM